MKQPESASTPQCILHWARVSPYAPAVMEQDATYGYGDLAVGIVQYVAALQASGVRPGMLVGLQSSRRYLHLLLILACEILGATSVSLMPAEVAAGDSILARCDFLCVGTLPPGAERRGGLLHLTQETIDRIACLPVPTGSLERLDTRPDGQQILRLARTSGSSGRPKVMAIDHAATERLMQRTALTAGVPDFEWNFVNLYNFPLRSAQLESQVALRAGKTVISSHFETVFQDLLRFDECRLTLLSGDAARMVEAIPVDWPGPRRCLLMVKAGALSATVRQKLLRHVATDIAHSYAANETYRLAMIDGAGAGRICEGVAIRIVDAAGRPVGPGETGLIEARSTSMVDGYLWDEAATRAAFVDGWYRTNDLGYMPGPDRLVVLGRADDMLNIGGVKIAPHGLEQCIRSVEGVADVVLVALPDRDGMPELNVVLELRASGECPHLHDRISEIITPYVGCFVVRVLDQLPRTDTGKVVRGEVRRILMPA